MAKLVSSNFISPSGPALYTYYAIMSLLVIFLAVTLIWLPFLQLITEFSTIVSKVITYLDSNFLDHDGECFFDKLASVLVNEKFLILTSALSMGFIIFLASSNFLMFAACYINNLPDWKGFEAIKRTLLQIILYLLYLSNSKSLLITPKEEVESNQAGSSVDNNIKLNKNFLALL